MFFVRDVHHLIDIQSFEQPAREAALISNMRASDNGMCQIDHLNTHNICNLKIFNSDLDKARFSLKVVPSCTAQQLTLWISVESLPSVGKTCILTQARLAAE